MLRLPLDMRSGCVYDVCQSAEVASNEMTAMIYGFYNKLPLNVCITTIPKRANHSCEVSAASASLECEFRNMGNVIYCTFRIKAEDNAPIVKLLLFSVVLHVLNTCCSHKP